MWTVLLWFPFASLYKTIAIIAPNINCTIDPTAKSETARFMNNFLKVSGNDEAFHRARITSRFPRVAMKENAKVKTQ